MDKSQNLEPWVSEEKSYEGVNGRRTDGRQMFTIAHPKLKIQNLIAYCLFCPGIYIYISTCVSNDPGPEFFVEVCLNLKS